MHTSRMFFAVGLAVLAGWLIAPESAAAQVLSTATVSGSVRSVDGQPVRQARVSLRSLAAGTLLSVTSGASGSFRVDAVPPGSYEVRVEALGFRPLVARTLALVGGDSRSLPFTLTPGEPPVTSVDTIALAAGAGQRGRGAGLLFSPVQFGSLPSRAEDLASVAALSPLFDGSTGARGLPGEMTLLVADGVPFYRAVHPVARSERMAQIVFPRSAAGALGALHNGSDVEWAGSAGSYLALSTAGAAVSAGLEADVAGSTDALWSSNELEIDAPALLSVDGMARGVLPVSPRASLLVVGDALVQETPLAPRIGDAVTADLAALDPETLDQLSAPGIERTKRFAGMVRYDLQRSATSRVFVRGAAAMHRGEFEGPGPLGLSGEVALPEESLDFSTAFGMSGQYSRRIDLEFRAGVSGSSRDFGGSGAATATSGYLAESGLRLGDAPLSGGASSRSDVFASPVLLYDLGTSRLKAGLSARASRHSMTSPGSEMADFVFSDAAGLLAGDGFGTLTAADEASWSSREFGLFAQLETNPSPGLRFVFGGRFDHERASLDAERNEDWFAATGIASDSVPTRYDQFGARVLMEWDPTGTGSTRIQAVGSLHNGDVDPRAFFHLLAEDAEGSVRRFGGSGIDWGAGTLPAGAVSLPSFTLLGPDLRPPRTLNFDVNLAQRLTPSVTFTVRGSMRRTDFLLRRRNLNLPLFPTAADPWGRPVYGALDQVGGVIYTTDADARRFAGFGDVRVLDPDGWSEYTGVTVGLEHASDAVDLYAAYTWSETRDNWTGAGAGSLGARLDPLLSDSGESEPWSEGISDFDVPHRLVGAATVHSGPAAISVVYRFESGRPFTPRYRTGVDANGDGSFRNDVAPVESSAALDALAADWGCLDDQVGGFAVRNACRAESRQSVDARLEVRLARVGSGAAHLVVEGFDLIESRTGIIDDALLLVDPAGSVSVSPDGSTVTVPVNVNPGFGSVLYPTSRGRMLRVGLRIGG